MRGDMSGGPIRWRMHIPVTPERVFDALDSNAGRAAFWAESAIESAGSIEFRFINGYTCRSRILRRDRPEFFALDYMGGRAEFAMKSDGKGGTDLLFTHHGMDDEVWNEVHAGWLNVLFPLKAWLVHGVDLRNHDAERSWDQGYADQ